MDFSNISYSLLPQVIIFLLSCFVVGHLILKLLKFNPINESFLDTFSKLLIGLFFIILLYSVILTRGITIQWGIALVGVIAIYSNKKLNPDSNKLSRYSSIKRNLIPLAVLILISVLLYTLQGGLFYNKPYNNIPHGDYSFYSTIIEGYSLYGIETRDTVINTMRDNYAPSMYHHTDLWIGSIFYEFSEKTSLEAFVIGGYTLLLSILTLGLIALAICFTDIKILHFISPFLIMFYGFPFWEIIPQIETFVFGLGFNTKNIMNALLFLPAILMLVKKNELFYIPLLVLPITNIINLPSVFGALILLGLLRLIKKDTGYYPTMYWIIFPIIISGFIVLFYFFTGLTFYQDNLNSFSSNEILKGLSDYPLRPFLIILGAIACICVLYILPVLLISIVPYKNKLITSFKKSTLFFPSLFICLIGSIGLSTWALLNILKDSAQFFYMPFLTALNLFIFITIFKVIQYQKNANKNLYRLLVGGFIFTVSLNYVFLSSHNPFVRFSKLDFRTTSYLNSIILELDKQENPIKIAYIVNPEKFKEFWSAIPYHQPDDYIKAIISETKQVSLSTLDVKTDIFTAQQKQTLIRETKQSPYSVFVDSLKRENIYKSNEKSQTDFIKNNNIKFLFVDSGMSISKELNLIVENIFIDEMSGEKFITLKY